jgi:hypothetical protein
LRLEACGTGGSHGLPSEQSACPLNATQYVPRGIGEGRNGSSAGVVWRRSGRAC